MIKIFIWGTGNYAEIVYRSIRKDCCEFLGFIDSDKKKQNQRWKSEFNIYAPDVVESTTFDYIIISAKNDSSIVNQCRQLQIIKNHLIRFWQESVEYPFLDSNYKKIEVLEDELKRYKNRLENVPYELGLKKIPKINSAELLLKEIIKRKCSLCRFGDGEFEILRGNSRPWFQKPDEKLSHRLKKVFESEEENILIGVADNFGNLEKYKETAGDSIREYLHGNTRSVLMDIIGYERTYWDAYVSRPYIIYKTKDNATTLFHLFKEVWNMRDVVIVEGGYSRLGIGNDLFSTANSIRRIVCPSKNAFDIYDEIIAGVQRVASQDDLILISLGPTATVIAYDLATLGYQALDIGQIDNEYEWYIAGVENRAEISGKSVAELNWWHTPDIDYNAVYENQIVWSWNEEKDENH